MNTDEVGDAFLGAEQHAAVWAAGMRVGQHTLRGRRAAVALWYPAAPTSVCSPFEYGGEPSAFRLDGIARDAPPAEMQRPRPLILLAGAADSSVFELGWLGAHLARSGNVVAAADGAHTVVDTCCLLTELAHLVSADTTVAGRFDPRRHAVAGFDSGGIAALVLAGAGLAEAPHAGSMRDPQVCAVALLNPCPASLLAPLRRGEVVVPVHVIISAADRDAPPREHGARLAASIPGARLTRLASPAGHHVFRGEATDEGRRRLAEQAVDAAVVHRGSVHECTATLVDALVSQAMAKDADEDRAPD